MAATTAADGAPDFPRFVRGRDSVLAYFTKLFRERIVIYDGVRCFCGCGGVGGGVYMYVCMYAAAGWWRLICWSGLMGLTLVFFAHDTTTGHGHDDPEAQAHGGGLPGA